MSGASRCRSTHSGLRCERKAGHPGYHTHGDDAMPGGMTAWDAPRCSAISPEGQRCKYQRSHDSTGEPHSWTMFGFGGPGGGSA